MRPLNRLRNSILILQLSFAGAVFAPEVHAQGGMPLWTNRYNGPANGTDQAVAVAVDGSGSLLVTGSSAGIGTGPDYLTIKYSPAGLPLWTNRFNGANGADFPNAVVADRSGNVFVAGYSYLTNGSNPDYVTVAYSAAGIALWTNRYDGPGDDNDQAWGMGLDADGNVFVTGLSWDNNSRSDYATIKYSGTGVPLWTNRYNGPGNDNDEAWAIAVDANGNVFVTGDSTGSDGYLDYATVAYSNAGVPLWTNRYDGTGNYMDYAYAVAVGADGTVFVTGKSFGDGSGYDYATVAYSNGGVPLWTNRYNGPANGDDYAYTLATDRDGNVFVAGRSVGLGTGYDYATIKYSGAGVPLWTNRYNGPGNGDDLPSAVAVDSAGNVFVTGYSPDFGGGNDYATIAYSNEGMPLWTNRYNGPGNGYDGAVAMAVDKSGNVFVTGLSYGNGTSFDYATIKYSSSMPPYLDIQHVNDQVVLRWTDATFGLQCAPSISGSFTNIPGATSPYTNSIIGAQQFFRLKVN
jgi:hypothetical protein